jgi:hypothetical protein
MNSENHNPTLKASREYAEAALRDAGLTLSGIVALYDAGNIDALLPPIADGTCGWCREHGLIRNIGELVCQECFPITMEMLRAINSDNTETYAVLVKKLDSRHTGVTIH